MWKSVDAIQSQWFSTMIALRDGPNRPPDIAAARAAIGPCLTARGIPVKDEDGVFGYVDHWIAAADSAAEMKRRDHAAGRVYAPCVAPLEKLLTPKRQALREQFLRDHEDEVRTARDRLDQALTKLADTAPARLVFPVP